MSAEGQEVTTQYLAQQGKIHEPGTYCVVERSIIDNERRAIMLGSFSSWEEANAVRRTLVNAKIQGAAIAKSTLYSVYSLSEAPEEMLLVTDPMPKKADCRR